MKEQRKREGKRKGVKRSERIVNGREEEKGGGECRGSEMEESEKARD